MYRASRRESEFVGLGLSRSKSHQKSRVRFARSLVALCTDVVPRRTQRAPRNSAGLRFGATARSHDPQYREGRRTRSIPLSQRMENIAEFGRPLGFNGSRSQSRARAARNVERTAFLNPWKQTPHSRLAIGPRSYRAMQSNPNTRSREPSAKRSTRGPRDAVSRRSSDRQSTPGSPARPRRRSSKARSLHASKIASRPAIGSSTLRLAPPRMELVATRPTRFARPASAASHALANQ